MKLGGRVGIKRPVVADSYDRTVGWDRSDATDRSGTRTPGFQSSLGALPRFACASTHALVGALFAAGSPQPNGTTEKPTLATADRLQLAATSSRPDVFKQFKDDKDLDVRLALVKNTNFRDQPWFQDFRSLYEAVARVRTIAGESYAGSSLDSLRTNVDFSKVSPLLDQALAIIARDDPDPKVRYALALNTTLTDPQRALFDNDAFLPIHRKRATHSDAVRVFDVLKVEGSDNIFFLISDTNRARVRRELVRLQQELGKEHYADAVGFLFEKKCFDPSFSSHVVLQEFSLLSPLDEILADRLLATGSDIVADGIVHNEGYTCTTLQLERMYAFASAGTRALIVHQENCSASITAAYAKDYAGDPLKFVELAASPHVAAYVSQLEQLQGLQPIVHLHAARNPKTPPAFLQKIASATNDISVQAALLQNPQTPVDLKRRYAQDPHVFWELAVQASGLDAMIAAVYFSPLFTAAEQEAYRSMIEIEANRHTDVVTDTDLKVKFLRSSYFNRRRIGEFVDSLAQEYHENLVDVLLGRPDLSKKELMTIARAAAAHSLNDHPLLFAHQNFDSAMLVELCANAPGLQSRGGEWIAIQRRDFIVLYLESRPPDQRLKGYVMARFQEDPEHYFEAVLALGDEALSFLAEESRFAPALASHLIHGVGFFYYRETLHMPEQWKDDKKQEARVRTLWDGVVKKGWAARLFRLALRGDSLNNLERLVISRTPGLAPDLYRRTYQTEQQWLADATAGKKGIEPNDMTEMVRYRAVMRYLRDNPDTPTDVLQAMKAHAQWLDDKIALARILEKRGIPDRDLSLLVDVHGLLTATDRNTTGELKALYAADPNRFLDTLDVVLGIIPLTRDAPILSWLPMGYLRRRFYSFEEGAVLGFAQLERFFDEIYLGDEHDPFLTELLAGKSAFTRAFVLTLLPTLNRSPERHDELKHLVAKLESVHLFDNSFLEYYLVSQLFIVRDAMQNGFIPPDQCYALLEQLVAQVQADVDDYGKMDLNDFFARGRRRLVTSLLGSSVFRERISGKETEEELRKWEILLQLGVRGIVAYSELVKTRRDVAIAKQFESSFFGSGETDKATPPYLQYDFHKAIFTTSQRITRYQASPNVERLQKIGLERDNAMYSDGTMTGDLSLIGGISPYGSNVEGTFYAELGHHFSEHVYGFKRLAAEHQNPDKWSMNYLALYEFDDRMAFAHPPLALEREEHLRDVLAAYRSLDQVHHRVAWRVLSAAPGTRKDLLKQLEGIKPEQFTSRKGFYLFGNARRVLQRANQGQAPETFEQVILGEGLYEAWKEGVLQLPPDLATVLLVELRGVEKRRQEIERFPMEERHAVEGGNFLSTYKSVYSMNGVPARPIISEKDDEQGRQDFSSLNRDEQHLTAEWLVYYTKRYARTLLLGGRLAPEEYFYFIHNVPLATKLLLKERKSLTMTDVIERIRSLTPEKLGRTIVDNGLLLAVSQPGKNRWISRLETKFRANSRWTLADLEVEIKRTRHLFH